MASTVEFVEYVCGQINCPGTITCRKMFGEYGVYYDGKFIGLICDNEFYVKKTKAGEAILGKNAEEAPPYPKAKPHFVVNFLENAELLNSFIEKSYEELPMQKARKKK